MSSWELITDGKPSPAKLSPAVGEKTGRMDLPATYDVYTLEAYRNKRHVGPRWYGSSKHELRNSKWTKPTAD